jgi:putative transposase
LLRGRIAGQSTLFPECLEDWIEEDNPEIVFAPVRHRTVRTKRALSAKTAKLMVFKLVNAAAESWRRLKGDNQLPKVLQRVKFQTTSRSSA